MLALIGLIPIYAFWLPNLIWKLFDMFIGGIQAFIFALLTVLYFGMSGGEHDDHDEAQAGAHDEPATGTREVTVEQAHSSTEEPALAR
jgi:F-type H+-transporting ATPase subunit a